MDCHPEEYKLICTIIEHNKNCTFLPSLHKIGWALRDGNGLLPQHFAPRALHSLYLTYSSAIPTPAQGDLVQQYTPFIRTLSIGSHYLMPLVRPNPPPVVDIALSLKYLETLRIWEDYQTMSLTPSDLQRLGKSPTIRDLDVHITGFRECRDAVKLPKIRRLRLVGMAVDISSLLRHIKAPALFDLELSCNATNAKHFVNVVRSLGGAPLAQNLCSLSLSASRFWNSEGTYDSDVTYEPDSVWYLSTLLRPCINMVKLQSFKLSTIPWENVITDCDDIREIAEWLPNTLRRLSFSHLHYPPWPPLTLLRHFARHCPNLIELEFLALRLDPVPYCDSPWYADDILPLDTIKRDHPLQTFRTGDMWRRSVLLDPTEGGHPLQTFRTGDIERQSLPEGMEREDVEAIGEYLHSLFPNLDMVRMRDLVKRNRPPTDRCFDSGYYVVLDAIEAARERQLRRDVVE